MLWVCLSSPGLDDLGRLWGSSAANYFVQSSGRHDPAQHLTAVDPEECARILREDNAVDPRRAALSILFHQDPHIQSSDDTRAGGCLPGGSV